jgi:hypothetical protein
MTLVSREAFFASSLQEPYKVLFARLPDQDKAVLARFQEEDQAVLARFQASKDAKTLSDLGASKGGHARAKSLSPERRSEIAKKAAETKWKRNK